MSRKRWSVTVVFLFVMSGVFGTGGYLYYNGAFQMSGISAVTCASKQSENNRARPAEGTEDEQLARIKYFEQRHRAAPGTNWREIDQNTRKELRQKRRELRKKLDIGKRLRSGKKIIERFEFASPVSPQLKGTSSMVQTAPMAAAALEGEWIERGSNNQSGRVHTGDVYAPTGDVYIGSAGGLLWRGTLNGGDWVPVNDQYLFTDINMVRVVDYNGGPRIIVLDDYNLHYSDDEGATWNVGQAYVNNGSWENPPNRGVVAQGTNTVYATASEGPEQKYLFRSTDMGEYFAMVYQAQVPNMTLWTSRYGASDVYMLRDTTLYVLNTIGQPVYRGEIPLGARVQFSEVNSHKVFLTGCDASGGPTLYALYTSNSGVSYIFRSTDGGATWSFRSSITSPYNGAPFMENSFSASTLNDALLYIGASDNWVFRSSDGGASWVQIRGDNYYSDPLNYLHVDIPGINVLRTVSGQEYCLIHTDGGTYISYDDIATVQNLSLHNLRISQYYSTYTHRDYPEIVFAGSQDQGFQRSPAGQGNGLYVFDQIYSGDEGSLVSGDNGETVWFSNACPPWLCLLRNATSATSISIYSYNFMQEQLWMAPLMEDPNDPNSLYIGGGHPSGGAGGYMYHITNNAGVWSTPQQLSYKFASTITAMAYSPADPDYRYVTTTSGNVYYSTNGGSTWNPSTFSGAGSHYLYGTTIVADPANVDRVYIAGSGYSNDPVYRSDNHGQNFYSFSNGLPSTLVNEMVSNEDGTVLFAATEVAPYACDVSTGLWEHIGGVTAPDQNYVCVDYVPAIRTARFGTYGRGIWDFTLTSSQTTLIDASFDSNAEGFAYMDDAFRGTSQPAYATGSYVASGGYAGGGLHVQIGGVNTSTITNMSGGWSRSFNLSTPGDITLSFLYNLTQSSEYESNEHSMVYVSLDGTLYGSGGN
ncbi:MAG: hypothetical protein JW768_10775, partial [Chitinispirillaceae bacterium]|nr:hypothetical protein [Chitinispirillaceae bacterium]